MIRKLIRWGFETFWPICSILVIYSVHKLILLPCIGGQFGVSTLCFSETQLDRIYSAALQIIGGLIVLYSIDSNLGLLRNTNIISLCIDSFKKFPLLRRMKTVSADLRIYYGIEGNLSVRSYKSPESIEEHIDILKKEIDWIKGDIKKQKEEFQNKLCRLESEYGKSSTEIKNEIKSVENKLIESAVGGLRHQVIGVILLCYGAYLNVT